MKQITIRPDKYGRIANLQDLYLKFGNENLTTEVTVDFEGVKEWYTDYVKYAYIFVGKTRRATFYTSSGNTLTFLLTQEDLQTGYITIQPAAKLPNANPELIKHVQWEHIKFDIKKSYDPITQDTTITISLGTLLQNQIDLINIAMSELQGVSAALVQDVEDLQDTKVDKVEGKSLILDTEITRLADVTNYDDTQVLEDITNLQDNKVDKVVGKVLSSNDYTDDEKTKLAGISAGAEVNSVTSVATRTGDVVLTKSDVGLANVDNTSDVNKPISTLQQEALNGKAPTVHTHTIAQVTNLQTNLDTKANKVQEAWITPTLLNGWTGSVQYMKDEFGFVYFKGLITGGTLNESFMTLPVGYRIEGSSRAYIGVRTSTSFATITVTSTGSCIVVAPANTNIHINHIIFKAEA